MASTRKDRLGFRGDSRSPAEIFRSGFTARKPQDPITYEGDSNSAAAVSLTWRLSAASYFPLNESSAPPEMTWIYFMSIDTASHDSKKDEIFLSGVSQLKKQDHSDHKNQPQNITDSSGSNIHGRQTLDATTQGGAELSYLFAQEYAVKKVLSKDILFAVKCKRVWNSENWEDGGAYVLDPDIEVNPHAQIDPEIYLTAWQLLNTELELLEAQPNLPMPNPDSGFKKNVLAHEIKTEASPRASAAPAATAVDFTLFGTPKPDPQTTPATQQQNNNSPTSITTPVPPKKN